MCAVSNVYILCGELVLGHNISSGLFHLLLWQLALEMSIRSALHLGCQCGPPGRSAEDSADRAWRDLEGGHGPAAAGCRHSFVLFPSDLGPINARLSAGSQCYQLKSNMYFSQTVFWTFLRMSFFSLRMKGRASL